MWLEANGPQGRAVVANGVGELQEAQSLGPALQATEKALDFIPSVLGSH